MDPQTKTKIVQFIRGWVVSLAAAVLLATSFKSVIADWNVVPSGSMRPTIIEGDRIFVNKLAYDLKVPYTTRHLARWADPARGDIVVFYSPLDGTRLVKRVMGLPGDHIFMRRNRLFVNNQPAVYEPLGESFIQDIPSSEREGTLFFSEVLEERSHPVMFMPSRPSRNSFGEIRVPDGHYFMLGDNRDGSADSRFFGFVPRRLIVGRSKAVVLSLNYDRRYLPRWDRTFKALP